jgi:DNA (cytosine-5)-methyltransferase 1
VGAVAAEKPLSGRARTVLAMLAYYGKKHPDRRPAVAHHRGAPARPARHPASPDPSDLATVREWVRSRSRPTAVDLFCGAGGLSLGLEHAGFDVVAGADSDAWAIETHAANLPGLSWAGDLSDPGEFLQLLEVCASSPSILWPAQAPHARDILQAATARGWTAG